MSCRRPPPQAPSRSRSGGPRMRSGRSRNSRSAGSFAPPAARPRRWMRPNSSCCGSWRRRAYEAFMRLAVAVAQEHPGLRSHRVREDHLDQGADPGDPARRSGWSRSRMREELVLDRHPNHVRLFYSKDDQGLARVTPKQLLESCLRMKPDRILLAELRAEEAFDYLRNVNSGHPGSITSIHAGKLRARVRAAGAARQAKLAAAGSWRARTSRVFSIS